MIVTGMIKNWIVGLILVLAGLNLTVTAENMIGNQSQNEGILIVPKKGDVKIDGDVKDWDLSGRIWVFADKNVRTRFSAKVAAMWDTDNLYLAIMWKDPSPMFSMVDPDFNPNDGWKSDSVQLRIATSDQMSWLTTWYFSGKQMPVLHVARWKDMRDSRKGQDVTLMKAEPGKTDLGDGAEMAYKMDDDKQGYVQEMKLPWKLIYKTVPEIKPGLVFRMGMEFLWGDVTGKTWPVHRYADNMQPGVTSREFFWTAKDAWGNAELVKKGNVPERNYVQEKGRIEGTVPIRIELPVDAARFTIAIKDKQGKTVRSMADLDPADYTVGKKGNKRVIEVKWDGLTDKVWSGNYREGYKGAGRLVAPGEYLVDVLYHKGLGAEYDMCFYNPGNPPWPVAKGNGAWGADHCPPLRVATAGKRMVVTWTFAEGGSGIICVGPDGLKKWGEKRGGVQVAADDQYIYAIPAGWHIKKGVIIRLSTKDGAYCPFKVGDKELPFEYPLEDAVKDKNVGSVTGIAVHGDKLAVALGKGGGEAVDRPEKAHGKQDAATGGKEILAVINKGTASLISKVEVPALNGLAYNSKGVLYGIRNGKIVKVDSATGKLTAVKTKGLGTASALTFDQKNNLVVADIGPDCQVKAFAANGALVYSCGRKGGRPIRGKYDSQAMLKMSSVAVDDKGHVWVVESWDYPRRVSVWDKSGKLVQDYIGNTGYAGTGSYLHDQDPTLAYVGPIEIKLDRKNHTWKVNQILWVPDPEKGESFRLSTGSHTQAQRFRSDASGKMHEYLYAHDSRDGCGDAIFMERNGKWQPVAAICRAGHISGKLDRGGVILEQPSGELKGLNAYDGIFWNDKNKDGKVQRNECEVIPTPYPGEVNAKNRKRGKDALSLDNGWGGRIGRDFVFYTNGLVQYKPDGFTDDGAPIYSSKGMRKLKVKDNGDLIPVPEEDTLLCLSWKGYAGPTKLSAIDVKNETVKWEYPNPYPGVHGSHRATMPKPGLLIGPLKILGVLDLGKGVGRVFAMRGNLGQDFFMTTDGVFVGTMFQDGRLPGPSLPAKEEQLRGVPMESYSNGGEPFNGWIGIQDDGKMRMTVGFPRQAAMILQLKGFDTIKRFKGPTIDLGQKLLAKVDSDNIKRAAAQAKAGSRDYVVKKLTKPLKLDAKSGEWKDIPALKISRVGSPSSAKARMAYDDNNLYLLFEVKDKNPWKNEGKDYSRLFKTGASVDLQLSPSGNKKRDPVDGDFRIVIAKYGKKPAAVLMRAKDKNAAKGAGKAYSSPVGTKKYDVVSIIKGAKIKDKTSHDGYWVEAAIPLTEIGLKPTGKMTGDIGFISSDSDGKINTGRTYWSNKQTNLVNDEPQESWLFPEQWGTIEFK